MKTTTRKFFSLTLKSNEAKLKASILPLVSTSLLLREQGLHLRYKDEGTRLEIYFDGIELLNEVKPFPALNTQKILFFMVRMDASNLIETFPNEEAKLKYYEISGDNKLNNESGEIEYVKPQKMKVQNRYAQFEFSKNNFETFQKIEVQNNRQEKLFEKSLPITIIEANKILRYSHDFHSTSIGTYDIVMSGAVNLRERFFLDKDNELTKNDLVIAISYDTTTLNYNKSVDLSTDVFTEFSVHLQLENLDLELIET